MTEKKIGYYTQLIADGGRYIHKLGTDIYAKRIILLGTDTLDMYEEVDEKPAYTKTEYDAKVNEFIREKYTESEEFAIQRKMLTAAFTPNTLSDKQGESVIEEFARYNEFVEECKVRAKDEKIYTSNN